MLQFTFTSHIGPRLPTGVRAKRVPLKFGHV